MCIEDGMMLSADSSNVQLVEATNERDVVEAWKPLIGEFEPPLKDRVDSIELYLNKISTKAISILALDCKSKKVVGCASFYANDLNSRRAYLTLIAVDNRFSGRGIGRALLKRTLHLSRKKGMERMGLRVYRKNKRARRLYESIGFIGIEDAGQWIEMEIDLTDISE